MKFNPKFVVVSVDGSYQGQDFAFQLGGFMDGEAISAKFDVDKVTKHTGLDGRVTLVLNADEGVTFTIELAQGSPSNDDLSRLIPNARRNFLPTFRFKIEDLNGNSIAKSVETVIQTVAEIKFGDKVTGRAWTITSGDGGGEIVVGGAGDF